MSQRVRDGLQRAGMNQTDLAGALGITQQAVSRRLLGRVPFNTAELNAVAAALRTTPADLCADEPAAPATPAA